MNYYELLLFYYIIKTFQLVHDFHTKRDKGKKNLNPISLYRSHIISISLNIGLSNFHSQLILFIRIFVIMFS